MLASTADSRLRNVLFLDALTCAACGTLLPLAAHPLADAFQLPPALLFFAGLVLLPIAAFMAFVGKFATHSAPAVWFIVGGNLAWIMASLWLLVGGAFAPNALGVAFVAAQAAVVAGLTLQEIRGALALRRLPSADAIRA